MSVTKGTAVVCCVHVVDEDVCLPSLQACMGLCDVQSVRKRLPCMFKKSGGQVKDSLRRRETVTSELGFGHIQRSLETPLGSQLETEREVKGKGGHSFLG